MTSDQVCEQPGARPREAGDEVQRHGRDPEQLDHPSPPGRRCNVNSLCINKKNGG